MSQVMKPRIRHDPGRIARRGPEIVEFVAAQRPVSAPARKHTFPGRRFGEAGQQRPRRFAQQNVPRARLGVGKKSLFCNPLYCNDYCFLSTSFAIKPKAVSVATQRRMARPFRETFRRAVEGLRVLGDEETVIRPLSCAQPSDRARVRFYRSRVRRQSFRSVRSQMSFFRLGSFGMPVVTPAPLGGPGVDPSRGAIDGAGVARGLDEGLDEHGGDVVALGPVDGQASALRPTRLAGPPSFFRSPRPRAPCRQEGRPGRERGGGRVSGEGVRPLFPPTA